MGPAGGGGGEGGRWCSAPPPNWDVCQMHQALEKKRGQEVGSPSLPPRSILPSKQVERPILGKGRIMRTTCCPAYGLW